MTPPRSIALFSALWLLGGTAAFAQDAAPPPRPMPAELDRPTWGRTAPAADVDRVRGWEWIPEGMLQPQRMADLRHPRFTYRTINPGGHRPQLDVSAGAQLPVLRYTPQSETAGWRFGVEIFTAIYMRFDLEHDTDLLGTDGYWGAPILLEVGDFVAKLEFAHISSHLGDETARTSGIPAIDYLKEEAILGGTWNAPYGLRAYFEAGWALRRGHIDGPSGQEWWRLQWGLDWVPDAAQGDVFPCIVGFNAESRQEVGWNITTTLHVGWILWRGSYDQNLRLTFDWVHGRSYVMQFHTKRVNWWAIGLASDF